MTDLDFWKLFFGSGGVVGSLIIIFNLYNKHIKNYINIKRSIININQITNIIEIMENLLYICQAERVLIVEVKNGGEIPDPTKKLYASVILESTFNPEKRIKSDFTNILLDSNFIKDFLNILVNEKYWSWDTTKFLNGFLLRHYKLNDTHAAKSYLIKNLNGGKGWLYLSIEWSDNIQLTEIREFEIEKNVELIKSIYHSKPSIPWFKS